MFSLCVCTLTLSRIFLRRFCQVKQTALTAVSEFLHKSSLTSSVRGGERHFDILTLTRWLGSQIFTHMCRMHAELLAWQLCPPLDEEYDVLAILDR